MTPNFLICGAPRCGTTFLAKNLAAHSDVYMVNGDSGEGGGDLHFFDVSREEGSHNFEKGLGWYASQFHGVTSEKAVGEKTADYLSDFEAPYLIKNSLGEVKIVLVLRDPVQRAVSHFWHSRHRVSKARTIDEFLDSPGGMESNIIGDGFYWQHISHFLSVFDCSQILVLINERLQASPEEELAKVCDFLGIRSDFNFPLMKTRINAVSASYLAYSAAKIGRAIRIHFPGVYSLIFSGWLSPLAVKAVKRMRGKRDRKTNSSRESAYPEPSEDTIERLRALYSEDVSLLSNYLGENMHKFWWPQR